MKNCPLDGQTRWATLYPQLVNLPGTRPLLWNPYNTVYYYMYMYMNLSKVQGKCTLIEINSNIYSRKIKPGFC